MLSLGDPEQTEYCYMLKGNQWRTRKGITFGTGAAWQGKTDNVLDGAAHVFFDRSAAFGADLLVNYNGWALDGECYRMLRYAEGYHTFHATEWHVRLAYDFKVANYFLEPAAMISNYKGSGDLFRYVGEDTMFDVGVNLYLKKDKVKLSVHYVTQEGSASVNLGNYFGAAFQVKL